MPLRNLLAFVAVSLAGCSSAAPPAPKSDAASDSSSSSSEVDSGADAGAACSCSADDAGVSVTSQSCFCAGGTCADHDASVTAICARSDFFNVVESTFSVCNLTRIQYAWGASGTTLFYDSTSGAFAGGRFDDDTPGECPGSSQPIGASLGTGTYELPASCVPAAQSDPCTTSDAGADGDAATDASPDGSAVDGVAP